MKKLSEYFYFNFEEQKDPSENYDNILIEIIDDVVKKRKVLHDKYDQLFEKLWVSPRNLNEIKFIAKKLLSRLLRESDLIFIRAQNLATRLCPKCEEKVLDYQWTLRNFIKIKTCLISSLWIRV